MRLLQRLDAAAKAELEALRTELGGIVPTEKIIEQARSENSALHRFFTWDDTQAAHEWRLVQATQVKRTFIKISPAPVRPALNVRVQEGPAPRRSIATPKIEHRSPEELAAFQLQALIHDLHAALDKHKHVEAPLVTKAWAHVSKAIDEIAHIPRPAPGSPKHLVVPSLPPVKKAAVDTERKSRSCITCGGPFMSAGAGHRMCDNCRKRAGNSSQPENWLTA